MTTRFDRVLQWGRTNDRWAHVLVLVVFAVLVCTGVTTSNITQDYLQPALGGREWILAGHPQEIRWDEYLGSSPTFMSILATGNVPAFSPLAAQGGLVNRHAEGGIFDSLVFFDSSLLRLADVVPESILFSLRWWLPTILLISCMPIWFRQLGFHSRLGWLAGLVIAVSPAVAWWSTQPVSVMGYTLAGCVALLASVTRLASRKWVTGVLLGLLSAVLLAGLPAGYVVWAIVLGAPLLVVSVLRVLTLRDISLGLRWGALAGIGAVTLGLAVGLLWDLREGIIAIAGTLYPGDRRQMSMPVAFEMFFGAPATAGAARGAFDPSDVATNASELATSWNLAFIVLAGILVVTTWTGVRRAWREWVPVGFLVAWGAAWLAWSTVSFGEFSAKVPVFNLVPSMRAAQVVGTLAVLAACMLMSRTKPGRLASGVIAGAVGAVTLYAASLLQQSTLPNMSTAFVWLCAIGAAAATYVASQWGTRIWGVALVAVVAALPGAIVNPLTVGLAAYRDSDAAAYFSSHAHEVREAGEVWASDFRAMDVMMLANGLPSLSGPQPSGPDVDAWGRLDPSGRFEEEWNRGGSRIRIVWADDPGVRVDSQSYNVITIEANPCDLKERLPELTTIMSRDALMQDCLQETDVIDWKDTPVHVYTFVDEGER